MDLSQWYSIETEEAGVEMLQNDAVVPFGTALWSM